MNENTNPRLEALKKRQAQLEQKIAQEERKDQDSKRKRDSRVKLLVGVAVISHIERHPEKRAETMAILDRAITRPREREFLKEEGWL
jgi:uncharacterized protein (DUF3084 family)